MSLINRTSDEPEGRNLTALKISPAARTGNDKMSRIKEKTKPKQQFRRDEDRKSATVAQYFFNTID